MCLVCALDMFVFLLMASVDRNGPNGMNVQVPQLGNGNWPMHNAQGGPTGPNNAFNQSQLQPNGGPSMPPSTPLQQNMQPNNAGTPSSARMMTQPLPPRSTATPMQMPNAQMMNGAAGSPSMPPGMSASPSVRPDAQVAQAMNGAPGLHPQMSMQQQQQQRNGYPALPLSSFNQAFTTWCTRRGVNLDERLLTIEGKRVDLHALHQEVLNLGGPHRVRGRILLVLYVERVV